MAWILFGTFIALILLRVRISIAIGAGGFSQAKQFRARFKPVGTSKPLHALLKICK